MLHARIHRKTDAEDELTAAVFGRLAYLPGEVALGVLLGEARGPSGARLLDRGGLDGGRASRPPIAPRFWPWFDLPDGSDGTRRQPDVVLPVEEGWLVVEAKRPGQGRGHSEGQVRGQAVAARARLGLGGRLWGALLVEPPPPHEFEGWPERIEGVPVVAVGWAGIAAACFRAARAPSVDAPARRVLRDIVAALALYGVHALYPLSDLADGALPRLAGPLGLGRLPEASR